MMTTKRTPSQRLVTKASWFYFPSYKLSKEVKPTALRMSVYNIIYDYLKVVCFVITCKSD